MNARGASHTNLGVCLSFYKPGQVWSLPELHSRRPHWGLHRTKCYLKSSLFTSYGGQECRKCIILKEIQLITPREIDAIAGIKEHQLMVFLLLLWFSKDMYLIYHQFCLWVQNQFGPSIHVRNAPFTWWMVWPIPSKQSMSFCSFKLTLPKPTKIPGQI